MSDTHTHGLDDIACPERLVGECVIEREVAHAVALEREALAREIYRCIHPGIVNTPDRARTRESDEFEADRAYRDWDAGKRAPAPSQRAYRFADRILAAIRNGEHDGGVR